MSQNPYEAPEADFSEIHSPTQPAEKHAYLKTIKMMGTGVLVVGLLTMAYGAVAYWLIPILPPNRVGQTGRFPSVVVMGAGAAISIVGLVMRDFRMSSKRTSETKKGIPGAYLLVGFIALVALLILGISQL